MARKKGTTTDLPEAEWADHPTGKSHGWQWCRRAGDPGGTGIYPTWGRHGMESRTAARTTGSESFPPWPFCPGSGSAWKDSSTQRHPSPHHQRGWRRCVAEWPRHPVGLDPATAAATRQVLQTSWWDWSCGWKSLARDLYLYLIPSRRFLFVFLSATIRLRRGIGNLL